MSTNPENQTEREARYAEAILSGGWYARPNNAARAAVALADQEVAEATAGLRAEVDGMAASLSERDRALTACNNDFGRALELLRAAERDRDAAQERLRAVEALADDMDERGRPSDDDSLLDTVSRRQVREDAKRLRATLASPVESDAEAGDDCYCPDDHASWCPNLNKGSDAEAGAADTQGWCVTHQSRWPRAERRCAAGDPWDDGLKCVAGYAPEAAADREGGDGR